jgi:hypothetical protein
MLLAVCSLRYSHVAPLVLPCCRAGLPIASPSSRCYLRLSGQRRRVFKGVWSRGRLLKIDGASWHATHKICQQVRTLQSLPSFYFPQTDRIFSYAYTTATVTEHSVTRVGGVSSLEGLGYGLPISRLYARYFGGDLHVVPMEGYGADTYLHLKRVSDADEPLP